MNIIINALSISLIVYFIKASTWKGMIWNYVHNILKIALPEKIYKPLIGCPVCMTPWWGIPIYFFAHITKIQNFEDIRAQVIVFTLFIASGFSTIILMLNKEYDVAIKEDKLLKKQLKDKKIE